MKTKTISLDGTGNAQLPITTAIQLGFDSPATNLVTLLADGLVTVFNISDEISMTIQPVADPLTMLKFPKKSDQFFYLSGGSINTYSVISHLTTKVPNTVNIKGDNMCPNWYGTKIYFVADLRINE
jgi:hypothetical protein